jgi:hypothetical protein
MPRKRLESDVELLVKRLRNKGFLIPEGYKFHSFKRGRHQKSAGLLSWSLSWMDRGALRELGSVYTVSEFIRRGGLDLKWL